MTNLTEAEQELIELIRQIKIEFGRVPCVIYFQDGKVIRIEYEKAIISEMAKK